MKKSFLYFLCFLCCSFSVAGVFRTSVPLYTIKTQYFDIIYPEESSFSASILESKADILYERLVAYFDVPKDLHLPVVLMPQTDVLNAYFTPYPYNHIVVYDTLPGTESLNVFSETLVGVFFHELVHAVSLNIRSDGWQVIADVFGDIVSPIFLVKMPLFLTEGVTVSFESFEEQQGRMHDSYSLQLLYQAKLERKFPSWKELTNARDLYPTGSDAYIIGGAFSTFLQKKYGIETYVEFWKSCDGKSLFNYPHFIKKYYGKTMDELWAEFQDLIPVPQKMINFTNSQEIAGDALLKSLTYSKDVVAWINSTDKYVYTMNRASKKIEKLFSVDSTASRLSFSQNGNYLVLSKIHYRDCVGENQLKIFDMREKSFIISCNGYRDGTVFQDLQGNLYIVGVKTEGQFATIHFLDFFTKKIIFEKKLPAFSVPSFLTDKGNGELLFIYRNHLEFYFACLNPVTQKESIFETNSAIRLRYLHPVYEEPETFIFGYTPLVPDGNQCRVGILCFDENDLRENGQKPQVDLQIENISGGFYNPLLVDDELYFISHNYSEDFLRKLPFEDVSFVSEVLQPLSLVENKNIPTLSSESKKDFNPFSYIFKKGSLFINANNYSQVYLSDELPFFAYGSCDPTESWQFSFAMQTGIMQNSFGLLTNIGYFMPGWYCNLSLQTSLLNFPYGNSVPISNTDPTVTYGAMLDCAKKIVMDKNYNILTLGNVIQYIKKNNHSIIADSLYAQYSSIRYVGLGSFEKLGLALKINGSCYYYPDVQKNNFDYFPSLTLQGVLPRLLPFSSQSGYTLNLPFSLSVSYLPLTQSNAFIELFTCTGNLVLFAKDTYLYSHFFSLNQFCFQLVGKYAFGVSKIESYRDSYKYLSQMNELEKNAILSLRTNLKLSYLYGSLSSVPFDIYFDFSYNIFVRKFEFSICGLTLFDKSLSLRSIWQKIMN